MGILVDKTMLVHAIIGVREVEESEVQKYGHLLHNVGDEFQSYWIWNYSKLEELEMEELYRIYQELQEE